MMWKPQKDAYCVIGLSQNVAHKYQECELFDNSEKKLKARQRGSEGPGWFFNL